jgi:uncharacterized protein (TIGR02246 family)
MTRFRNKIQIIAGALLFAGVALAAIGHYLLNSNAKAADAPKAAAAAAPALAANDADDKAIRATADAFVKAFNAGNAKAIGAEWAADAEYTDETGQQFHGAGEIERAYADLFKEHPGAAVSITIDSIRFLGPDIALEKGIAKVTPAKGDSTAARYTVVHARRDGKWVMVVGHDNPYVSAFGDDYLKDLGWLVGDWKTESKDQPLAIKFEWMAQHNFIKNTFMNTKDGKPILTGGQIIGWDPRAGRIVSWHFEAEGGFGHDVWSKDGDKWIVRARGTMRDGSETTATNIITPVDANSFTWQSTKRTLDGVNLPDVPPVKIVRVEDKK